MIKFSTTYLSHAINYFSTENDPKIQEYNEQALLTICEAAKVARDKIVEKNFPLLIEIGKKIQESQAQLQLLETERQNLSTSQFDLDTIEMLEDLENQKKENLVAQQFLIEKNFERYSDDVKIITCFLLKEKGVFLKEADINAAFENLGYDNLCTLTKGVESNLLKVSAEVQEFCVKYDAAYYQALDRLIQEEKELIQESLREQDRIDNAHHYPRYANHANQGFPDEGEWNLGSLFDAVDDKNYNDRGFWAILNEADGW